MDSSREPLPKDEVAASLRASRELGPDYDDAVAAALAERIETTIDERIRHHLAAHARPPANAGVRSNTARMVLSIISLGLSLPLTIAGAAFAGAEGVALAWIGLIVFYVVSVIGFRR
ncbi:MAG: hypothetical protein M0026_06270 [Nocardiopsaceae bacterium]|nr:hypothetical protein [Nocardiopsaceae bacterium]